MAHIELSTKDLNALIEIVKAHKADSELNKVNNFRLSEDGKLVFEQSFSFITTTVQLFLSQDVSGQFLLIDIISLAENYFGNKALGKFIPLITEIIDKKTNGLLAKQSERQLALDLSKILPVPMILENCNISKNLLNIDVSLKADQLLR